MESAVYQKATPEWLRAGDPRNWLAQYNLGCALDRKGRYQDAYHHYTLSLKHHPWYAAPQYRNVLNTFLPPWHAHNSIGVILANDGKIDLAEQHFRRALEMAPKQVLIIENLKELRQFKQL